MCTRGWDSGCWPSTISPTWVVANPMIWIIDMNYWSIAERKEFCLSFERQGQIRPEHASQLSKRTNFSHITVWIMTSPPFFFRSLSARRMSEILFQHWRNYIVEQVDEFRYHFRYHSDQLEDDISPMLSDRGVCFVSENSDSWTERKIPSRKVSAMELEISDGYLFWMSESFANMFRCLRLSEYFLKDSHFNLHLNLNLPFPSARRKSTPYLLWYRNLKLYHDSTQLTWWQINRSDD
jgi:hypothetical protein